MKQQYYPYYHLFPLITYQLIMSRLSSPQCYVPNKKVFCRVVLLLCLWRNWQRWSFSDSRDFLVGKVIRRKQKNAPTKVPAWQAKGQVVRNTAGGTDVFFPGVRSWRSSPLIARFRTNPQQYERFFPPLQAFRRAPARGAFAWEYSFVGPKAPRLQYQTVHR